MSLARRSITSSFWTIGASILNAVILFGRSVLLARWLEVETFGVYAFAGTVVSLSAIVTNLGMNAAFMHRAPESEDEQAAAATHFTIQGLIATVWLIIVASGAMLLASGSTRVAILVLAAVHAGLLFTSTPEMILKRRVVHRRLAVLQIVTTLSTTGIALFLAFRGVELWALLATDIVTLVLFVAVLYLWRPIWRPRFSWSRERLRYFFRFGSKAFVAYALVRALEQVDDLWTGIQLGDVALGFYSRAYRFATYPRSILAGPVSVVASGTFAELKGNPRQLSQSFFRVNALLIRGGFLFAGILALIAPEFIRLLLGEKWLPMLDTFRLMLLFAMLEPLKAAVSSLFVAVGEIERVIKIRLIQLVILVLGLFSLGTQWGIEGVAVSVDLMAVVGTGLLYHQARDLVRFSAVRLFLVPTLALTVALVAGQLAVRLLGTGISDWQSGLVKILVFCALFAGILLLGERKQMMELGRSLVAIVRERGGSEQ